MVLNYLRRYHLRQKATITVIGLSCYHLSKERMYAYYRFHKGINELYHVQYMGRATKIGEIGKKIGIEIEKQTSVCADLYFFYYLGLFQTYGVAFRRHYASSFLPTNCCRVLWNLQP